LVAQIALRALHAIFTVDRFSLVGTVVFNGIVDAIDPVTGQTVEPCLITLRATREQFTPLVLANVDPSRACVSTSPLTSRPTPRSCRRCCR
jgi:restriction system protein